jgi:hypothetical protein
MNSSDTSNTQRTLKTRSRTSHALPTHHQAKDKEPTEETCSVHGNANHNHNNTYQDNDKYNRPDESDNFITKNPCQCATHAFMTNKGSNTTKAIVLYNLMLNDTEQNLRGVHCFTATGVNRYTSQSTVNAALAQANNMPYPLECWGCCNPSDPKKHAEKYHPWRNCSH